MSHPSISAGLCSSRTRPWKKSTDEQRGVRAIGKTPTARRRPPSAQTPPSPATPPTTNNTSPRWRRPPSSTPTLTCCCHVCSSASFAWLVSFTTPSRGLGCYTLLPRLLTTWLSLSSLLSKCQNMPAGEHSGKSLHYRLFIKNVGESNHDMINSGSCKICEEGKVEYL